MFNIGMSEMLIIAAIALVVMGPKNMPQLARTLGQALVKFKRMSNDFKQTLHEEMNNHLGENGKELSKLAKDVRTNLGNPKDLAQMLETTAQVLDKSGLDSPNTAENSPTASTGPEPMPPFLSNPQPQFAMSKYEHLKTYIRNVPDFPKPGIQFKDVTTLFQSPQGMKEAMDALAAIYKDKEIDKVAGIESRGFVLGAALADRLGKGLVLVRKKGKLPYKTIRQSYALEYGTDELEVHIDAFAKGDRVLLVDDLLATGGTFGAAAKLVEACGAKVASMGCIIELTGLPGRKNLAGYDLQSLITYDEA